MCYFNLCGQILQCCGLTPEYARLLTTNHLEAHFHAVGRQSGHLTWLPEASDKLLFGTYHCCILFAVLHLNVAQWLQHT